MNANETTKLTMFRKVASFCESNAADFAETSSVPRHVVNLNRIIAELTEARVAQVPTGVTAKDALLDALRLDIRNIARTALAIAQDEPGFDEKFTLPRRFNQASFLATAETFLTALKEPAVAEKLIAKDLPANLAEHLAAARQQVLSAMENFDKSRVDGVGNTAAVARLVAEGMKEVHYLDAIVHNRFTRMPDKLRAWECASHIGRTKSSSKPAEENPEPEPQPLPQPAIAS